MEDPGFHCAEPAAAGVRRDAAHHLGRVPLAHLAIRHLPAVQPPRRNVDPVQRLFVRHPHRAFTDGVAGIENEFGSHQCDSNGPASTNAPPWNRAAGSAGSIGGSASILARNGSELSFGSKPMWAALLLSH